MRKIEMLKGKVALVTGSTSGIGLGIAKSLAKEGAGIMLNGLIAPEEAERIRFSLAKEFGVPVQYSPANISRPAEILEMIEETSRTLGSLDILVNNAGVQHVAPIEEFPLDKWDAILAINLSSVFHAVRAALPAMRKRNWGRIVNIASTHGLVASANKSAYVAAKHGVIGLTKTVALETAKSGVTCNAICPGWVLTPLVQKQIDQMAAAEKISNDSAREKLLAEKQPSLEFASPEQIGALTVFLCSEAAVQIRGAAINVDGGWVAQ
jgi:3-hydroxybutyrate dehydrogenase